MNLLKFQLYLVIFFLFFPLILILLLSPLWAMNGPHAGEGIRSPQGVCANCHVPHEGTGPKIWAQPLDNTFGGIRRLCFSCHDGTFTIVGNSNQGIGNAISGIGDVFNPAIYEDHVMHGGADIEQDYWLGYYDEETFPLQPEDEDIVPTGAALEQYRKGGKGFYCGSCHNVHQQPPSKELDGDYLRTKPGKSVGTPGDRGEFCVQCHDPETTTERNTHLENSDCLTCHHPHRADTLLSEDEQIGRSIFVFDVVPVNFSALPNVPHINDTDDDPKIPLSSAKCYACHQPNHLKNGDDPFIFLRAGAAPIYGDYRADEEGRTIYSQIRREHHPMGDQARLNGSSFPRARGVAATQNLNSRGELTCVSCHAGLHGETEDETVKWSKAESKKNNFLRWNFKDDNALFCVKCHPGKKALIKESQDKKHFWTVGSRLTRRVFSAEKFNKDTPENYWTEIECRQCMLCHFIHDGQRDQDAHELSADLDALMRVPPENPFTRGDTYRFGREGGKVYYEDMCFGCHINNTLVLTSGKNGSFLDFTAAGSMFSHRYTIEPDQSKPPYRAMIKTTKIDIEDKEYSIRDFPLSDGESTEYVVDDYGTEKGQMYCGSCHDVHDPSRVPYLNYPRDTQDELIKTAYEPYGFCEDCHNAGADGKNHTTSGEFIKTTHPIDEGPNNSRGDSFPTVNSFPDIFQDGGSGTEGGVLYEGRVICLTCHNVHAAETSWNGYVENDFDPWDTRLHNHGSLLVVDNMQNKSDHSAGSELCKTCHPIMETGDQYRFPEGNHGDSSLSYFSFYGEQWGICNACHTPHNAQGPKLWAIPGALPRDGYTPLFGGYRQLCYTCHNNSTATTGFESVFKGGSLKGDYTQDHIMHEAATTEGKDTIWYKPGIFPLDEGGWDKDTIPDPKVVGPSYSSGPGLYCGSCHDPHRQGYIRGEDPPFICLECHKYSYIRSSNLVHSQKFILNESEIDDSLDIFKEEHEAKRDCFECHHPHKGRTRIEEDQNYGKKILTVEYEPRLFRALPNVPEITESEEEPLTSSFCYGCHGPFDDADKSVLGAPQIYGDDASLELRREHHPMGTATRKRLRALGTPAEFLNNAGEITCISCHDGFHGKGPFDNKDDARKNNFLRGDFINDNPEFCVTCHTNKSPEDLGAMGAHYQTQDISPVKRKVISVGKAEDTPCGGCMFCHFIHDGKEQGNESIPQLDALMRKESGSDTYVSLCYGCHLDRNIVGGQGSEGALLKPEEYFMHPLNRAIESSRQKVTSATFVTIYPVSDGVEEAVLNDYGVDKGQMYCGTCHDAHRAKNLSKNPDEPEYLPYLRGDKSPYEVNGFCEECHDNNGEFLKNSHSLGKPLTATIAGRLNLGRPLEKIPLNRVEIFYQGGSGNEGGVTSPFNLNLGTSAKKYEGEMVCLTCHSIHTAVTSPEGATLSDEREIHGTLLVDDNFSSDSGDDLCTACHNMNVEGPHRLKDRPRDLGVCSNCHSIHNARGDSLHRLSLVMPEGFGGTRSECNACHTKNGLSMIGVDTVFNKGAYQDHVMHGAASLNGDTRFRPINQDTFTLNLEPDDWDTVPLLTNGQVYGRDNVNYNSGGEGFYCGSCHDPHTQPGFEKIGGKYLRYPSGVSEQKPGERRRFCISCHQTFEERHFQDECLKCHHPHRGRVPVNELADEREGRKILTIALPDERGFVAKPNVNFIIDNPADPSSSSRCYGCHGPSGARNWYKMGASLICGDDSLDPSFQDLHITPKEHHPMGDQAHFETSLRAPGAAPYFNEAGQLTCTSCHIDHTRFPVSDRSNNYLRGNFINDFPEFCTMCHLDKDGIKLGPPDRGHHRTRASSPLTRIVTELVLEEGRVYTVSKIVPCGECMFCHYVHDGSDQGPLNNPAVEALMRVPPLNLRWGDKWDDTITGDYEDLCFGCHSNERIVGGPGMAGSLLIPPPILNAPMSGPVNFTHRFASVPLRGSSTEQAVIPGGIFPLSDGPGAFTVNDYGTQPGQIFCGSCHDVHDQLKNPEGPYLRGFTSPYKPGGFCPECHLNQGGNHPLGIGPLPPITPPLWRDIFYSNTDPLLPRGTGSQGGFIAFVPGGAVNQGLITCLTCHNIHAARTTFDGYVDRPSWPIISDGRHGNLLVMDNGDAPAGSALCINCHPEHAGIVGSFHDFSSRGLDGTGGGIADHGVCSACHKVHNAQDTRFLWSRPLVEERSVFVQNVSPAYTLGSTLYCYDCHAGVMADPDPQPEVFGAFIPQDIAGADGPGGMRAGYYEILPEWTVDVPPYGPKTGGHFVKSPLATPGISQYDKLPCNDCHNPHRGVTENGVLNQAFIKAMIGGKPVGAAIASNNMSYHPELRNNSESKKICIACHGVSYKDGSVVSLSVPFNQVNPTYTLQINIMSPPPNIYDHSALGTSACTDCHRHNRISVLCIDCHSYPPLRAGDSWQGPGDLGENYPGGAGAHRAHVADYGYSCSTCHVGCLHNPGGATLTNPLFKRSNINITFDPTVIFPRGTRVGYPELGLIPTYNPLNQTCFVGCHNPVIGDQDRINLSNPSPSWSLVEKNLLTVRTMGEPQLPVWMPTPVLYLPPSPDVLQSWQIPWPF
ncbi:MAG: cytochrome c3 family protein [bacterium]